MGGSYQGDSSVCDEVTCPAPKGSCCKSPNLCLPDRTDAQCVIPGAFWAGPATSCDDLDSSGWADDCENFPVTEACCFQDGVDDYECFDVKPETCIEFGGEPQGEGTLCESTDCANPERACCMPDNSCMVSLPEDCTAAGGTVIDDALSCDPNPCPVACCFADGSCQELVTDECVNQGGVAQAAGTSCTTFACPQPEACCFSDESCQDIFPEDCTTQGGTPAGAGTTCATYQCPQFEACCFGDGHCEDLFVQACTDGGGAAQGDGSGQTECSATECPQPNIACCLPDGSCQDITAADCENQGGVASAYPSECAGTTCPQPEACCYPDGSCADLLVTTCTDDGGTPAGDGTGQTECSTYECPQAGGRLLSA